MQTFNIHRFGNTLLWQLADYKKKCLNILAFGFLFSVIGGLMSLATSYNNITEDYANNVAITFSAFYIIYMLTFGTFIASDIEDKKQRINAFILPASKLEKYISRYIYLLIAMPLFAFIGLAVGDLVQMAVIKIATGSAYSISARFFDNGLTMSFHPDDGVVSFFALWQLHSFLLLLGTCFRRRAWIKSALTAVGIAIVLGITLTYSAKEILDLIYGYNNYNVVIIDAPWVSPVVCLVLFAIITFNYWASYRIYARMQAVNTKWYNF